MVLAFRLLFLGTQFRRSQVQTNAAHVDETSDRKDTELSKQVERS
jgi:hypothetical protein